MRILSTPDPKGWRVIMGIKAIRMGCGINLKDAKILLDRARRGEEVLLPVLDGPAEAMHRELTELGLTMEPLVNNVSIRETVAEMNEGALMADGLEDALIGYVERFGQSPLALYDREKCIEIFMRDHECPCEPRCEDVCDEAHSEAVEMFEFNTIGAWAGDGTPAFATILRKV